MGWHVDILVQKEKVSSPGKSVPSKVIQEMKLTKYNEETELWAVLPLGTGLGVSANNMQMKKEKP